MNNLVYSKMYIPKYILAVLLITLVIILPVSHHAYAWESDWIIWEDPDPINYYIDFYDSTYTKAAYNSSIDDWESVQSKADFYNNPGGYDLYLDHTDDSELEWCGHTWKWYDEYYYITYVMCQLNEHYTDAYETDDERCNVSGHELGHALGLLDEDGAVLMNGSHAEGWGEYEICTPQQDDINGINTLYY